MQWSLEDIYRKQVRGKIPPRRHLRVLGEAKVNIKFDDPPEEVNFHLPDYYAREVMGYTAGAKHHIDGLVRKWLEKAAWSEEGVSKALPQVKGALHSAFGKKMKDPNVVKGIANEIRLLIENKPNLLQFDKFVLTASQSTAGAEDLFDVFSEVAGSSLAEMMYPDGRETTYSGLDLKYLNNKDFLAGLFQINFSEGQVAVGPGEVAMTLYSSAYNPPKGDLKTTSVGEVEMKGKAGRVGKGTEAVAVDREIKKHSRDEHLDEERLRRLNIVRDKITNKIPRDLIKYIPAGSNAYKALVGLEKIQKSKDLKVLKDKDVYDRIRTEAPQAANVGKIIEFLKAGGPEDKTIKYGQYGGKEVPVFHGEVEPIQNALQDIMSDLYDIDQINANGMTTRFNTFWRGDESRWEDMIFKYVPKEHRDKVRDDIQQHIGGRRAAEAESARIAQEIAAAAMISTYQSHEKFNYIMFANTNKKIIERGACPAVVIGPFSNNYKNNLKLCLEKIELLKISPNVERGSGFNIEVM
jgi:hypothetical protein